MHIALSVLDESRFGVITAKAIVQRAESIEEMIAWCESRNVAMLIARCECGDIHLAQAMEQAGFFLTDTLVHYLKCDLTRSTQPVTCGIIAFQQAHGF